MRIPFEYSSLWPQDRQLCTMNSKHPFPLPLICKSSAGLVIFYTGEKLDFSPTNVVQFKHW